MLLVAVSAEPETYIPEYELQQNEPILIRYFKKKKKVATHQPEIQLHIHAWQYENKHLKTEAFVPEVHTYKQQ